MTDVSVTVKPAPDVKVPVTVTAAPAVAVASLDPNGSPVSRTRRAVFAFLVTLLGMLGVFYIGVHHTPVPDDIAVQAVKSLADVSIFVGIGYIGGSVVDYSGFFGALGARVGLKIPFRKDKPSGDDGEPGEGN